MYCNRCGAVLQPGQAVCASCGTALPAGVGTTLPTPVRAPERLAWHVRLLAIFWYIVAALWLIPAIVLFVLGSVAGAFIQPDGPEAQLARALGPLVLYLIGGVFAAIAALCFAAAWGLQNLRAWARAVAIVLGVISLIHPPFGTALGIYTLWVLLSRDADVQYGRLTAEAAA